VLYKWLSLFQVVDKNSFPANSLILAVGGTVESQFALVLGYGYELVGSECEGWLRFAHADDSGSMSLDILEYGAVGVRTLELEGFTLKVVNKKRTTAQSSYMYVWV